ncbi:MAG TPA: aminoacetone oxidase family FAD-binding enzyme [Planctomycetaceae bacterium]|nr:aminoacetone oxidase family FAD-binding enzyme [Planctomycetaceae bacterium]
MNRWDVIVVGAGPAGLLAACRAAERGRKTLLLEKNRVAGVKISISGGGHCNVTHAADARGVAEAFGRSGRFLRSALAALDPARLVGLLEAEGVACRTEPDGKILPASDRADDVLAAFLRRLGRSGATLKANTSVADVLREASGFRLAAPHAVYHASEVVLTTGGQSYPGCGTTGDGYAWAAALGHAIVAPRPALVPITTDDAWVKELQGITLPDVRLSVVERADRQPDDIQDTRHAKPTAQRRGSLLFAHFGLSGPVAMDLSRHVSAAPRGRRPTVVCDFLPGVSREKFDAMLAEAAAGEGRRQASRLLGEWLPARLAEALCREAQVPPDRRAAELARHERLRLVAAVKEMAVAATGTLGFEKAEVTAGGVALDEIDSRSMQSKLIPGLFIAGELLDVDGPIGGYNLQAAFSTGHLAGERL